MKLKFIDLCSGIGGFRLAIESFCNDNKIKHKCVLSADIKQDAINTYNLNFNESNKKININTLKPTEIPKFDLLCAGFPCQPFSTAGNKKGFNDKRGGIIFKIIDICKHHKPKYILLENVSNLLNLEKGKCIKKIADLFEELDYKVVYKKLNSKDFGCPQSRDRVYILCSKTKLPNFNNISYSTTKLLVKDIMDKNDTTSNIDKTFMNKLLELHNSNSIYGCKLGDKRGGKNNIHSWSLSYNGKISKKECQLMEKIMLERRKKHWAKKKNIIWMDGMPLTKSEIETFFKDGDLQKMLNNLVDKKYLRLEKCKDLVNGKRVYKKDSEEGYNICKGKLSFPISKILDPNDVSPTLTATDSSKLGILINDECIRKLNVNELKKLCGFPDSYKVPKNVNIYDLFGNMATPPVIKELIKLLFT